MFASPQDMIQLNEYKLIRYRSNVLLCFGVQLDPSHLIDPKDESHFSQQFSLPSVQQDLKRIVAILLYEYINRKVTKPEMIKPIYTDQFCVKLSLVPSETLDHFDFVYKGKPLQVIRDRLKFEITFFNGQQSVQQSSAQSMVSNKRRRATFSLSTDNAQHDEHNHRETDNSDNEDEEDLEIAETRRPRKQRKEEKEVITADKLITWWENNYSPVEKLNEDQCNTFEAMFQQLSENEKKTVRTFLKKQESETRIRTPDEKKRQSSRAKRSTSTSSSQQGESSVEGQNTQRTSRRLHLHSTSAKWLE